MSDRSSRRASRSCGSRSGLGPKRSGNAAARSCVKEGRAWGPDERVAPSGLPLQVSGGAIDADGGSYRLTSDCIPFPQSLTNGASDASDFVTQITTAEAEEGKQDELLALMTERARFMARQPAFISISLHRGLNGKHIVNYVQWANREQLVAAHRTGH